MKVWSSGLNNFGRRHVSTDGRRPAPPGRRSISATAAVSIAKWTETSARHRLAAVAQLHFACLAPDPLKLAEVGAELAPDLLHHFPLGQPRPDKRVVNGRRVDSVGTQHTSGGLLQLPHAGLAGGQVHG